MICAVSLAFALIGQTPSVFDEAASQSVKAGEAVASLDEARKTGESAVGHASLAFLMWMTDLRADELARVCDRMVVCMKEMEQARDTDDKARKALKAGERLLLSAHAKLGQGLADEAKRDAKLALSKLELSLQYARDTADLYNSIPTCLGLAVFKLKLAGKDSHLHRPVNSR